MEPTAAHSSHLIGYVCLFSQCQYVPTCLVIFLVAFFNMKHTKYNNLIITLLVINNINIIFIRIILIAGLSGRAV